MDAARPDAIATGIRVAFAAAASLIVVALAVVVGSRALSGHFVTPGANRRTAVAFK
jgi:hypothetical protein